MSYAIYGANVSTEPIGRSISMRHHRHQPSASRRPSSVRLVVPPVRQNKSATSLQSHSSQLQSKKEDVAGGKKMTRKSSHVSSMTNITSQASAIDSAESDRIAHLGKWRRRFRRLWSIIRREASDQYNEGREGGGLPPIPLFVGNPVFGSRKRRLARRFTTVEFAAVVEPSNETPSRLMRWTHNIFNVLRGRPPESWEQNAESQPRKHFEAEDSVMQSHRHKPESLESLVKMTNFSKQELQLMYRGFKQHCPSGMVSEETFKEIFANFFPQGESDGYAHLVFRIFDTSKTGMVTFEQFVMALSILSRGSVDDRLRWTFNLYDVNKDGFVTRDDMHNVITSVYHMMGKWCLPHVGDNAIENHVDYIFEKMDLNKDGMITIEEFMTSCKMDKNIVRSMSSLDTVL